MPMKRMRNEHTQILDFCATDGIRSGIHYECGFAIAMTSRIIAILRESYDPSLENKTIDMYGKVMEGDYPDWRKILNALTDAVKNEPYREFLLNHEDFKLFYQRMVQDLKKNEHLVSNYYVACDEVYFVVDEFKRVADMMNTKGMAEFNVYPYDSINGTRPSYCCNNCGVLAIMPTRLHEQQLYSGLKLYPLQRIVQFIKRKN